VTRVLACTGAKDPLVPLADVAAFSSEMDAAGADWQLIVYGRALHSFTNRNVAGGADPRMDYDPAADRQSWAAALLFLDEAFSA
jgi:dienelactone hydrolase